MLFDEASKVISRTYSFHPELHCIGCEMDHRKAAYELRQGRPSHRNNAAASEFFSRGSAVRRDTVEGPSGFRIWLGGIFVAAHERTLQAL